MRLAKSDLLADGAFDKSLHLLDFIFQTASFLHHFDGTEEQMQIALSLVIGEELAFDGSAVNVLSGNAAGAACFKGTSVFIDDVANKRLAALDHHDKTVVLFIHVADVGFTEISAVNDEADVHVSVSDSLVDHESELADIIDRPRIELIEEWNPVVLVHGKADIENRQSEVNLGLPELDKIDIPCLTVLIRGVIRHR